MNVKSTMTREQVEALPYHNYRDVSSSSDKEELKSLAIQMMQQGQLVPVLIARIDKAIADGHKDVAALLNGQDLLVMDGERRCRAFLMMPELAGEGLVPLDELKVEQFDVKSYVQLLEMQLSANLSRKDSGFCEAGRGFHRYIANGGSIKDLLKVISWDADHPDEKSRVQYIKDRLEFDKVDPSLWPMLDSGILYGKPGKKHQLHQVAEYPQETQQRLAKYLTEMPVRLSKERLTGLLNARNEDGTDATWDPDDKKMAIKKYGERVCSTCEYARPASKRIWDDEKGESVEVKSFECRWSACFQAKLFLSEQLAIKAGEEAGGYVFADVRRVRYGNSSKGNKDGVDVINNYEIVEEGDCPNALFAVSLDLRQTNGKRTCYICPASSKCPVHHSDRLEEMDAKRADRIKDERVKLKVDVRKSVQSDLTQRLAGEVATVSDKLNPRSLILDGFRHFFSHMGYDAKQAFCEMLGIGDYPHGLFTENSYRKFVPEGKEMLYFRLAGVLYMKDQAGQFDQYWEDMAKALGTDFDKEVEKAMESEMAELKGKQQKRLDNVQKEKDAELACLRYISVELACQPNADLESEDWWNTIMDTGSEMADTVARKIRLPKFREMAENLRGSKAIGRFRALQAMFPDYVLTDRERLLVDRVGKPSLITNVVSYGDAGKLLSIAYDSCVTRFIKAELSIAKYTEFDFELPYAADITVRHLKKTAKKCHFNLQQTGPLTFSVVAPGSKEKADKEPEKKEKKKNEKAKRAKAATEQPA